MQIWETMRTGCRYINKNQRLRRAPESFSGLHTRIVFPPAPVEGVGGLHVGFGGASDRTRTAGVVRGLTK